MNEKSPDSAKMKVVGIVTYCCRGERYLLDPIVPHRLQNIECRNGILFQVLSRMLQAEAHIRVGRHVKNKAAALHRSCESGEIRYVPSYRNETL